LRTGARGREARARPVYAFYRFPFKENLLKRKRNSSYEIAIFDFERRASKKFFIKFQRLKIVVSTSNEPKQNASR